MKQIFIIIPALLSIFSLNLFRIQTNIPNLNISKQESAINFRKDFFLIINLGLKRLIADTLWIETLLDSDLEHYNKGDFGSWMFLRFDLMTDLDNYFLEAYRFGGNYFSVVKDDKYGASYIFEKGLKYFPKDYSLNFYGGIHDFLEMNAPLKAYQKLSVIQNYPEAPYNIKSIMAKIIAGEGQLETAFQLVYEIYKNEKNDNPLKIFHENILYSLRAEIDLECLNSKKDFTEIRSCSKKDFLGNSYVFRNNFYEAVLKWNKVRAFKQAALNNQH